ncbi:MAG: hypothetical protein COW84_11325 [Gammaproteobacteria bacterium CG22_combo_CG10-13_8_21_14_all_40_8]|nr:MAG: hypothetical protein COW84_11325 [Gammaproteobacteria bacterium CG22_combo_CG10-13_8_21_14_all_40_8]
MKKSILFIISETPYMGIKAAESIDAALAVASYGHPVSIWFCAEGVINLLQDNDAKTLSYHDHCAALQGLDYFEIENVIVTDLDYNNYQLEKKSLRYQPDIIQSIKMIEQLANYQHIFRLS